MPVLGKSSPSTNSRRFSLSKSWRISFEWATMAILHPGFSPGTEQNGLGSYSKVILMT